MTSLLRTKSYLFWQSQPRNAYIFYTIQLGTLHGTQSSSHKHSHNGFHKNTYKKQIVCLCRNITLLRLWPGDSSRMTIMFFAELVFPLNAYLEDSWQAPAKMMVVKEIEYPLLMLKLTRIHLFLSFRDPVTAPRCENEFSSWDCIMTRHILYNILI